MPNRLFELGRGRFYPTADKLANPKDIQAMLKQILDQHYALSDRFEAYKKANPPQVPAQEGKVPLGSGPVDTMLLGLRVAPIDAATLTDGTKLTWVKAAGNFQFK